MLDLGNSNPTNPVGISTASPVPYSQYELESLFALIAIKSSPASPWFA